MYLDHAATTPLRPDVLEAMLPYYNERFGNPSSAHRWGREARAGLEQARERIAGVLGVKRSEIVFTSGGTEADNLAVLGRLRAALSEASHAVIACSAIEHKAVLAPVTQSARNGTVAVLVAVNTCGRIEMDAVAEAIAQRPAVLSVMWVNNEVGTVQPIAAIAEQCAARDVVLHSDAVQAIGRVPVRVHDGVSLLSVSGHKLGAPKGIGALFVRSGVSLAASQLGGGQERGVRPGTENIAAAIGLATALEMAVRDQAAEAARLGALRDKLEDALVSGVRDLQVNGAGERVPHILNVSVPNVDQEALFVALDLEGIAVSTASACQSGASEPSHVLVAMGRVLESGATMRLSLGRTTTEEDINNVAAIIPKLIERVKT